MLKILHISNRGSQVDPDGPLAKALRETAELKIVEQARGLSREDIISEIRRADILITNWASTRIPDAVADDPGKLKYVLNLGGTCKATVPLELIRKGIKVTNWGDTPAQAVAEGAATLLLAVLKDLRGRTEAVSEGKCWGARHLGLPSGTLQGLKLGLYGCGVIGTRFVEMMRPFKPEIFIFDPYANGLPEDCRSVESIGELFDESEAVVVWAGLSDETNGSVTAELLAKLPDHGIIVNAARGEIIDQDALFAELESGRLRAGLDVMVADNYFEKGHEAHSWPNLIMTCHDINSAYWPERPPSLGRSGEIAVENVKRFIDGEPLQFVMDEKRYMLSS